MLAIYELCRFVRQVEYNILRYSLLDKYILYESVVWLAETNITFLYNNVGEMTGDRKKLTQPWFTHFYHKTRGSWREKTDRRNKWRNEHFKKTIFFLFGYLSDIRRRFIFLRVSLVLVNINLLKAHLEINISLILVVDPVIWCVCVSVRCYHC